MTAEEKQKLQDEILGKLPIIPHGRLLLAPRVGKTRMAIKIMERSGLQKFLYVTLDSRLAKKDIPSELKKWDAEHLINKITIVTWKSLHKMKGFYPMAIFDEDQHITERSLGSINSNDLSLGKIVSMTGTETKNKEKLKLYKRLNLDVLYKIDINDAVDIGLLANYTINIVDLELDSKPVFEKVVYKKPIITSEKSWYIHLNYEAEKAIKKGKAFAKMKVLDRTRFIANCPTKTSAIKVLKERLIGKKIVFCNTTEQAAKVGENIYHGKTNDVNLTKFLANEIEDLILVNKGGTGYTYTKIEHLIIGQSDSDDNGLTSQKIARTLLEQGSDYSAVIWILRLKDTIDEKWIEKLLRRFDSNKVNFLSFKDIYGK